MHNFMGDHAAGKRGAKSSRREQIEKIRKPRDVEEASEDHLDDAEGSSADDDRDRPSDVQADIDSRQSRIGTDGDSCQSRIGTDGDGRSSRSSTVSGRTSLNGIGKRGNDVEQPTLVAEAEACISLSKDTRTLQQKHQDKRHKRKAKRAARKNDETPPPVTNPSPTHHPPITHPAFITGSTRDRSGSDSVPISMGGGSRDSAAPKPATAALD
jgi:hypothetical protein